MRKGDVSLWLVENRKMAKEVGGMFPEGSTSPMALDPYKNRVILWGWDAGITKLLGKKSFDHIEVVGSPKQTLLTKAEKLLTKGRLWCKRHVVAAAEDVLPHQFDRSPLYGEPVVLSTKGLALIRVQSDSPPVTLAQLVALAEALEAPADGVGIYAHEERNPNGNIRHCDVHIVVPGVGTKPPTS